MNTWMSGYCYSPASTLPSLQSLLFGACSSAEQGLSDRTSEVGQRGEGTQVLLSGSFTEKEWPVSANAPSACLQSFLRCPCALFIQWLPCWHKDLPFAQMVDSRGPPCYPNTHRHTLLMLLVLHPLVQMEKWKKRKMDICTIQDEWSCCSLFYFAISSNNICYLANQSLMFFF